MRNVSEMEHETPDRASQTTNWRQALFASLQSLDRLLEAACDAAEQAYATTAETDPYRGFYVSPQDFRSLLGRPPGAPLLHTEPLDRGGPAAFASFQRAFMLSDFDLDALLIALAPEIDLRYQRLFAYLQDDVTRKRPSVDLVLNLFCPTADAKLDARARFGPDAPLVRHRLLQVVPGQGNGAPFLARELEIDEAVVSALTGDLSIDRRLQAFTTIEWPATVPHAEASSEASRESGRGAHLDALRRIVEESRGGGRRTVFHFQGPRDAGGREAAAALAGALGRGLLAADVRLAMAAATDIDLTATAAVLLRDARLHDAILLVDGLDALRAPEMQPKLAALFAPLRWVHDDVVILASDASATMLDDAIRTSGVDIVSIPFALPGYDERLKAWQDALGTEEGIERSDLEALANRFRLTTRQIGSAVASARSQARLAADADMPVATAAGELYAAARGQSTHRLGTLAKQIQPKYQMRDLVLPDDALAHLQEVCNQVRRRHVVYGAWGFDRKLSLGKGINVLFSGPPGVGKTMAAEVFAYELGLDLFKIDLSQIVSKYIGETEKNLNRVFDEARASNAILFFDEADALFGKRSEVRDSHDRYANIEIAYLLQKMDEYEGLSVLATNLKQNLDEAFTRRLSFIIDFPFPDDESRLRIWQSIWPSDVPLSDDVDLGHMARTFRLSGGSIKNVAVAAAFLAAEEEGPIRTSHLVRATRRELQKMGKTMAQGDLAPAVPRTKAAFAS
jgi:AAA+ superfamily predicted ATPase